MYSLVVLYYELISVARIRMEGVCWFVISYIEYS